VSNNFDGPVIIDQLAPTDYFGFGRAAGGSSSTGPRIMPIPANPSAGAGIAAPLGTIGLLYTAGAVSLWQKTTAPDTGWVNVGQISGGPIFPTSIDTTGTAAFQWTMADNVNAAVSLGSAGALGMLVFNTTNGTEQLQVNATAGLKLFDNVELVFGTGDDLTFAPNGTDVTVNGAGTLRFQDDVGVSFGTGNDFTIVFTAGTNTIGLTAGVVVDAAGASLALTSQSATSVTGPRASGVLVIASGSTDSAGNIAGDTGAVALVSGVAADSGGQGSGNSGAVSVQSGSSATGNSGNVILTTGAAGGTRGFLDINAPVIDTATQDTDWQIRDNRASSLQISVAASDIYLQLVTTNGSEAAVLGSQGTATAQSVSTRLRSLATRTDGIDHTSRLVLTEQWTQRPEANASIANDTANKSWELLPSATANAPTSALNTFGGVVATTAAVAVNDGAVIRPHLDANQSAWEVTAWSSNLQVVFKSTIHTFENTDVRYETGLRATPTAFDDGTDNDKMMVRFDSSDGVTSAVNWVVVTSAGGVDVLEDSGVACAANADINMAFVVAATSRQTSVYINGALVNTPANHVLAVADIGTPYVAAQSLVGGGGTRRIGALRTSSSQLYS